MAENDGKACKRCGGGLGEDASVAGVRARASGHGVEPSGYYCGPVCRSAALAEGVGVQCSGFGCAKRFPRAGGQGRPALYHDEACKRTTAKVLDRALKRLARGAAAEPDTAAELEVAHREQEFLLNCWQGRAAKVRNGRPFPTPPMEPEGQMVRVLADQVGRLHRRLAEEREYERAAAAARQGDEWRAALRDRGRRIAEEANGWRVKILGGVRGGLAVDRESEAAARGRAKQRQQQATGEGVW